MLGLLCLGLRTNGPSVVHVQFSTELTTNVPSPLSGLYCINDDIRVLFMELSPLTRAQSAFPSLMSLHKHPSGEKQEPPTYAQANG